MPRPGLILGKLFQHGCDLNRRSQIALLILSGDLTDYPAGIADGDAVIGYVPGYHAAGADDAAAADGHSGQNRDIAANPDIITDDNRISVFKTTLALLGIRGVAGG